MKNWLRFLLCCLLSAGIWFIHNLSKEYLQSVNIPVLVSSNIEGRAITASSDVYVAARVRATGFVHLGYSMGRGAVAVFVESSELKDRGDGVYLLGREVLLKYSEKIFGSGVTVESVMSDDVVLNFAAENHKKVPVLPVKTLSFRPEYMAAEEMRLSRDSVVIYGPPAVLDGIEYIATNPINLYDIHRNVHGTAAFRNPAGIRLSEDEVSYSMNVVRYYEVSARLSVKVQNLPENVTLMVLPQNVSARCRCSFPIGANPFDNVSLYVDYDEFARSINGKCMIRVSGLPANVISCVTEPEFCDCVETRN